MWKTSNNYLKDDGSDSDESTEQPDPDVYQYTLFPEFNVEGYEYVSPFLYKFNEIYNYYEGWLFYPEMLITFATVEPTDKSGTSIVIPSIYLNIIYNKETKTSTISLKSYQKLQDFQFTLSIPELDIVEVPLEGKDDSTFSYNYTEDDGYLINPVTITVYGKSYDVDLFTAKTALISQRYDITDLLQIPVFTFNNNNYLVDVPVMLKSDFEANTLFYLDKIKDFIETFNFEDNRMVSDNLEFRMLNTDKISSYILLNSIVQGKNLYKNMNYIGNINVMAIADNPDTVPGNNEAWIINGTPIDIVSTNISGSALDIYADLGYGGLLNAPDNSIETDYSIIVDGDYTAKIKSGHIIRIKDCVTENINGEYHVVSSQLTENNQTVIYVLEKLEKSSTEGQVYYATYEPWRVLGPDNLAIYKLMTKSWEVQKINVNDIVTVSQPNYDTYYYTKNYKYQEYVLRLPLRMILNIIANKNYVIQNSVDLEEQRNMIKLQVARYLQLFNTGTDIVYYPAQIIDFVLMERPWIKSVTVTNTDSSEEPFELINGIEALPEDEIRDNISTSKMDILKYSSAFYYWDVNNIEVNIVLS